MKAVPVVSHDKIHTDSEFQAQLDEILSRELDARTIDSYADEALADLVTLVGKIVTTQSFSDEALTGVEREQRALRDVGLDPYVVETTLDHIVDVSESTKRLDRLVMRKTKLVHRVIVPPDDISPNITPGDGSFENPKEQVPKLKTLLLLLEKGFDVDIKDNEQMRITTGVVRRNMMRSASYYMVEIPSLRRTVLVCDEIGNTTFVFNAAVCSEYGITAEYLSMQTKSELKEMINKDNTFGRQIDYSSKYVDRLSAALLDDPESADRQAMKVDILRPKALPAPEGVLSLEGMHNVHGIGTRLLQKAIYALSESLGEVQEYRFGTQTTLGYSLDQQRKIIDFIQIAPPAPEGFMSRLRMMRVYKIDANLIQRAVDSLGDSLGEVREYRFGPQTTTGYSPDQQKIILNHIKNPSDAPEGIMSRHGMYRKYGIENYILQKAIDSLGDSIGEVQDYRFGSRHAAGYSFDQQRQIIDWIHQNNKRVKLGGGTLRVIGIDS